MDNQKFSYGGASEIPNKEFVKDALDSIDTQLREIAKVVFSTNDPELKRQLKEALKHMKMGFDILESMDI